MKRLFLSATVLWAATAAAQPGTPNNNIIQDEGRAPYRSEFISYDIRKEADTGEPYGSKYYRPLVFKLNTSSRFILFETNIEIPLLWLEREVFIRDEGRTGRYRLKINGQEVGVNTDSYGMNEFYITPYLKDGFNKFSLEFTADIPGGELEHFTLDEKRLVIENLRLYSQPKIRVFDYYAAGRYDPEVGDMVLALDVILVNGFRTNETVTVGYDIYDPMGNLKDYGFEDVAIPAYGCDTVSFRNKVFGTEKFRYTAEKPELYKVMISLKHQGRGIEYIPFRIGFGSTKFDGDKIMRNDRTIYISAVEQDAPNERNTLRRLRLMKRRGINTLYLTRPQQKWFYDMCEEEGMYIIDRAAVDCDSQNDDRGTAGTIANNPGYAARFIDRQQNMYHRNKNRPNVIGWAIGSDCGNGYNMYKSYQWLKSVEPDRMVVYPYARGEWNTDMEIPDPQPLEKVLEGMSTR